MRDGGSRSATPMGGGVHGLLKRFERRLPATYLLGHDRSAAAVPRMLARVLSSYERARAREVILILSDTLPVFDGPLLWLLRRAIFAVADRPRGDDDPALDMAVPSSGWAGNVLALGCWATVFTGLCIASTAWSPV